MNFKVVKMDPPSDNETFCESCKPHQLYIKTDAFTVLPPFSPQISSPQPTPNPYRILPPIVSRKRPTFAILQEVSSRPASVDPSPSGRVSPFRGCGFKPPSREGSPARESAPDDEYDKAHQPRSRPSVAVTKRRRMSKSVSPVTTKTSSIPRPLNRRVSYSPDQLTRVITGTNEEQSNTAVRPSTKLLKSTENLQKRDKNNVVDGAKAEKPVIAHKSNKTANICSEPRSPARAKFIAATPRSKENLIPINSSSNCGRGAKPPRAQAKSSMRTPATPATPATPFKSQIKIPIAVKSPMKSPSKTPTKSFPKSSTKSTRTKSVPTSPIKSPSESPTKSSPKSSTKSTSNTRTKSVPRSPTKSFSKSPSKAAPKSSMKSATSPFKSPTRSPMLKYPLKTADTPKTSATSTKSPAKTAAQSAVQLAKGNFEKHPSVTDSRAVKHAATVEADKFNSVLNVNKKTLTTSNRLKSKMKAAVPETSVPENLEDEIKDFTHTDTSLSLPISIDASRMTDSSVALIRTTTEPALAPVQPHLIHEIRSAINGWRGVEEVLQSTEHDASTGSCEMERVAVAPSPLHPIQLPTRGKKVEDSVEQEMAAADSSQPLSLLSQPVSSPSPKPKTEDKNGLRPIHVVAVTEIEQSKPEIVEIVDDLSTIEQIQKDVNVRSFKSSVQCENQNGANKSSWLSEMLTINTMTKPLTKMAKKEEKSIECLVLPEKSNRWQKFKSSYMRKVSRKLGTHPGPVTTISKRTSSTTQTMSSSSNKSCRGKYFCCFCYKCKLKKRSFVLDPSSENPRKSRCPPELPRWPCKTGFESLFRKPACYRKKKKSKKLETQSTASTPEGVTCVSVSTPERCCCSPYQTSMIECLRILCCWNSSFCVKLRCKCDKWCSSCKKCCLCCKRNEKTAIAETERRRSNVSQIRKPSWTRVFTDFPKLDPSFVDHVSVMRGAIPVLPVPLAWICLILNVFLPGFGTLSSGIFCLFVGKPRFSINDSLASRFGSFLLNLLVACSQLFTVLFCLVGWGWSVWWGVIILRMAKRSKRIMMAEQGPPPVSTLNMKNRDLERGAAT